MWVYCTIKIPCSEEGNRKERQRDTDGSWQQLQLSSEWEEGGMEKGKAMLEVLLLRWAGAELLRD